MKKLLVLPVLAALLLSACGSNEDTKEERIDKSTSSEETKQSSSQKETTQQEEENQTLEEIGDVINDPEEGTFTLENIKKVNQDIVQGGITIHIEDVKVITVSNMTDEYKEMLEQNADIAQDGPLTYMQVRYSFENTLNEPLTWSGFNTAVKEDGTQVDLGEVDIIGMQNPSQTDIQGQSIVRDNLIGIPVDKDVKSIRLVSGDVLKESNESEDFIVYGKETTINLD